MNAQPRAASERQAAEWALRVDLAAAFRIVARLDWHESVGNHFSAAVSADGKRFLMNPKWRHFTAIKASELLLLDSEDRNTMQRADAPDASAWAIHGQLHARIPAARCILHLHPPYATALAALADPSLLPIDQNTARFYGQIAHDLDYGGLADSEEEGARLAAVLGEQRILMMGNHGVLVAAATVAEAFEDLYFLERSARTLMLAYATGKPLHVMTPELARRTAEDWKGYAPSAFAHFEALKHQLDAEDSSYAS
jgi:ribulose-5-phosphate 4-epimerase/fuculose-1-phosphate aldolase